MVDNTNKKVYKLYDQGVIIPFTLGVVGVTEREFNIYTGSRLLFDLYVKSIDPGATITVDFLNNFTTEDGVVDFENILSISTNTLEHHKKILTDFNQFFKARVTIVGGNVEYALAINVFDNAMTTVIENAEIDAHITSKDVGTRLHDSVRIGDQDNELEVNDDGSINVNIVSSVSSNEVEKNIFNEAPAVVSGIETSIVSYTVPALITAKIQRISFSGQSIGTFNLYKNGNKIDVKHTWFNGPMFGDFVFIGASEEGQVFAAGDKIELKVLHNRTSGDFTGRIQLIEIM